MELMKRVRSLAGLSLLLGVGATVPGCGGDDDDVSPAAACREGIGVLCGKIFNCFTEAELQAAAAVVGNSTADCKTKLGTQCSNDGASCDAGEKFNSSRAEECIEGYRAFSCTDIRGYFDDTTPEPAACELVCEQQ